MLRGRRPAAVAAAIRGGSAVTAHTRGCSGPVHGAVGASTGAAAMRRWKVAKQISMSTSVVSMSTAIHVTMYMPGVQPRRTGERLMASVVTSRNVGTKVASTQPHVSSVYSRKSTKYLPVVAGGAAIAGGATRRGGAQAPGVGSDRWAPTVVVAHSVDDPRAEVVHVEHDALGHRAVVRAWRAVEPAPVAEAVARRELRVAGDAVVPRLRHRARVG